MKPLIHNKEFNLKFEEEIDEICKFYNIDNLHVKNLVLPLSDYFEKYWEMVFSLNDFELITSGNDNQIAKKASQIALELGISKSTISLFEECSQTFPIAILGLKLSFSQKKDIIPTLYVRTMTNIQTGLKFLGNYLNKKQIEELELALQDNQVLYGLGFSEKNKELYIKTYTIGKNVSSNGDTTKVFLSYRLTKNTMLKENKTYLPDVSLSTFQSNTEQFSELVSFLVKQMNYSNAGHIGILRKDNQLLEYKIYIERIGNIPTDYSAQ